MSRRVTSDRKPPLPSGVQRDGAARPVSSGTEQHVRCPAGRSCLVPGPAVFPVSAYRPAETGGGVRVDSGLCAAPVFWNDYDRVLYMLQGL